MPRARDGSKVDLRCDMVYNQFRKPSEKLLLLHASVSRVLKLSGRGEKLEKLWRDFDERKTLAVDGSSMELLNMAIDLATLQDATRRKKG